LLFHKNEKKKKKKKELLALLRGTTLLCILLNHAQILKIALKILSIFHIIFQNFMLILKSFGISE